MQLNFNLRSLAVFISTRLRLSSIAVAQVAEPQPEYEPGNISQCQLVFTRKMTPATTGTVLAHRTKIEHSAHSLSQHDAETGRKHTLPSAPRG